MNEFIRYLEAFAGIESKSKHRVSNTPIHSPEYYFSSGDFDIFSRLFSAKYVDESIDDVSKLSYINQFQSDMQTYCPRTLQKCWDFKRIIGGINMNLSFSSYNEELKSDIRDVLSSSSRNICSLDPSLEQIINGVEETLNSKIPNYKLIEISTKGKSEVNKYTFLIEETGEAISSFWRLDRSFPQHLIFNLSELYSEEVKLDYDLSHTL